MMMLFTTLSLKFFLKTTCFGFFKFFFKLHIHFYLLFFEFSVLWSEHFLKTQFEGDV